MKLPATEWANTASLKAVTDALGSAEGMTRYVGGAVRDTLLGLPVTDVDLATVLKPEEVMARLAAAQIKTIPTGIAHGTVTAVTADGPVEITTLRRDVSTDGRRATVAFSDDWREDAARRDFTINALSADPVTGEVFDYFGGVDDLQARRIRFIGSAEDRIAEDYLRIMRYFRFLARFGKQEVDAATFEACRAMASGLANLSRERVADELLKLLGAANPVHAVQAMISCGIFTHIMHEIDPAAGELLARLVRGEEAHGIKPEALRRLIALLPKDAAGAGAIAKGLKLSKKMQRAIQTRVSLCHDERPSPQNIRAAAYYTSVEAARDGALLCAEDCDVASCLEGLEDWQPPVFPLTGGDLIAQGLEPGPIVAETLAKLERAWVDEGFVDEARVREIAYNFIRII